ncbi:MAG: AtpZ/AtpI family protein [Candidatus Latescibacterota bacterium]
MEKGAGQNDADKDAWRETFRYIGLISQVGLGMAASILIAFLLGLFLDRTLHTGPVFMILGIFGGVGMGFWNTYRLIAGGGAKRDGKQAV